MGCGKRSLGGRQRPARRPVRRGQAAAMAAYGTRQRNPAAGVRIATRPAFPIRGNQLGNRTLNNTVDAWTVAMWEQYFRDLAVFGANTVELLPPQANGWKDSPHSPLPLLDMMAHCSRLLDEYGMDVWIWFPALAKDYSDPATVESELRDWTRVYERSAAHRRHLRPRRRPWPHASEASSALSRKAGSSTPRFHPKAQLWVSPQGWDQEWMNEFLTSLRSAPEWLNGVVHGPGVRMSVEALRAAVPERYGVRTYPDITHTVRSQHPVPDWDPAWAFTYGREPINPRPAAQREIFLATRSGSKGFVTYSDGANDDVNKAVWSALGWIRKLRSMRFCEDYGRYFIGARHAAEFAQGLRSLERSWTGRFWGTRESRPRWRSSARWSATPSPSMLANWRFQQALYAPGTTPYIRNRLIRETALEARAMELLDAAPRTGSLIAMREAERTLDEVETEPQFQSCGRGCSSSARLFQSIGMQLSGELYGGYSTGRAATLDTIDAPLNDRRWLRRDSRRSGSLPDEAARKISTRSSTGRTRVRAASMTTLDNPTRSRTWCAGRAPSPRGSRRARMDRYRGPVTRCRAAAIRCACATPVSTRRPLSPACGLRRWPGQPGARYPAGRERRDSGASLHEEAPSCASGGIRYPCGGDARRRTHPGMGSRSHPEWPQPRRGGRRSLAHPKTMTSIAKKLMFAALLPACPVIAGVLDLKNAVVLAPAALSRPGKEGGRHAHRRGGEAHPGAVGNGVDPAAQFQGRDRRGAGCISPSAARRADGSPAGLRRQRGLSYCHGRIRGVCRGQ